MTTQPTGSSPFDKFDQLKQKAAEYIGKGQNVLYDKKDGEVKGSYGSSFIVWLKTSFSAKYEKVGTKLADLLFKEIKSMRNELKEGVRNPLAFTSQRLRELKANVESGTRKANELKTEKTFAKSVSNRNLQDVEKLKDEVTTLSRQRNDFDESENKWTNLFNKLNAQPVEDNLAASVNIRVIQDQRKVEDGSFGPFADKVYCNKKLEAFTEALKAKIAEQEKRLDPQHPDFNSLTSENFSQIRESIEMLENQTLGMNQLLEQQGFRLEVPDFKFVEMKIAALTAKQKAYNEYQVQWQGVLLASGVDHQNYKDFVVKYGNHDFSPFGISDDLTNKKAEYAAKVLDEGLRNLKDAAELVDFLTDPTKNKETSLLNSTQRRDYQKALEEKNFDEAVKFASPHLQKAKEKISVPDFLSVEDQAKLRDAGKKLGEKLYEWKYNMDDRIQKEVTQLNSQIKELMRQREVLGQEKENIAADNQKLRRELDSKLKFAAGAMDEMKQREERLLDTLPVWPLDRESAFGDRCEQASKEANKMTLDDLTKFAEDLDGALLALVQQSKFNEARIGRLQAKLGGAQPQESEESLLQILDTSILDADTKAKLSDAATKQTVKSDTNSALKEEYKKDIATYALLQDLIRTNKDAETIKAFLDKNDLSEFNAFVEEDELEVLEGQVQRLIESTQHDLIRLETGEQKSARESELNEGINESTSPTERLALRAKLAAFRGEDAKKFEMAAAFADGSHQRSNEALQPLLFAMGRLDMTQVGDRGNNITERELGQALLNKIPELKKPENKRRALTENEKGILRAALDARKLIPIRDEAYQLAETARKESAQKVEDNLSQHAENERAFLQAQEELQKAKEALAAYAPILDYVIAVKAQRDAYTAESKVRDEVNRNSGVIRGEKDQALKAVEDEVIQHRAKLGNLTLLRQSLLPK